MSWIASDVTNLPVIAGMSLRVLELRDTYPRKSVMHSTSSCVVTSSENPGHSLRDHRIGRGLGDITSVRCTKASYLGDEGE